MRKTRSRRALRQHLFLQYGLTALGIVLVFGLLPYAVLNRSINREIRLNLVNTNRSIEQIIAFAAQQEIKEFLQLEAADATREVESIYREALEADLSDEEARRKALSYLLLKRIGEEGYFYVIDSSGRVVQHPRAENIGQAFIEYDFIRTQIEEREGFLEYRWRNPEEAEERDKALAMEYIPELDWIVTASAYKSEFVSLVDVEDIEDFVLSVNGNERQYSFVLDSEMTMLIHPLRKGQRLTGSKGTAGEALHTAIIEAPSGFLYYDWHPLGKDYFEKKLLYYSRLEEFDWIIATAVYLEDARGPLRQLGYLLALLSLLSILTTLLLSLRLSNNITRPVEYLIAGLNRGESGDYSTRAATDEIAEIDSLGRHFNRFMIQLEQGRQARKKLDTLTMLSETVFQNTIEGITITDLDGNIRSVNQAFTDITGYTEEEAIGKNPNILRSDHHPPEFYEEMWKRLKREGNWSGEIWNRRKSGEAYPEWLTITALYNDQDEAESYIAIFHDISDQKQNEERLKYQAYHDALTGLPNRELFKDRLEVALAGALRSGESGAVIFMDLDDFKEINDSLGHQQGDSFLTQIAARLAKSIRDVDTVARLGGDEFTILLPKITDQGDAVEVVERIIETLEEPLALGEKIVHPRASFGITLFPDDGSEADRLMSTADMAMYRTKQRGDGRYTLFNQALEDRNQRRRLLEERLRSAIVKGHLQVHYQAQFDLEQDDFIGMEALIRWNDPEMGWISPGEFIPVAEGSGLINAIDGWVLRTALKEIGELNRTGDRDYALSVNVSAVQLKELEFVESILSALERSSFPPELLHLEITESTAMENITDTVGKIERLRSHGVQFAIDDFGTGYSSLSYLNRLQASVLKIDHSFIRELEKSRNAAAIVTSVISLGKSLEMKIVAEGVETEEQLEFLRGRACTIIQGYLFARPIPFSQLRTFLATPISAAGQEII